RRCFTSIGNARPFEARGGMPGSAAMSLTPFVAVLLAQALAPLAGTAVDREGRPLAGVEVVLAEGQALDGTVPVLARATTDAQGRYVVPSRTSDRPNTRDRPFLAAYRPGLGLVVTLTRRPPTEDAGFRLALD